VSGFGFVRIGHAEFLRPRLKTRVVDGRRFGRERAISPVGCNSLTARALSGVLFGDRSWHCRCL
jgi:hypothetical protein